MPLLGLKNPMVSGVPMLPQQGVARHAPDHPAGVLVSVRCTGRRRRRPSRRLDDEALPHIASERPRVGGIDSLGTDPFDLGGHTPQRTTSM